MDAGGVRPAPSLADRATQWVEGDGARIGFLGGRCSLDMGARTLTGFEIYVEAVAPPRTVPLTLPSAA